MIFIKLELKFKVCNTKIVINDHPIYQNIVGF